MISGEFQHQTTGNILLIVHLSAAPEQPVKIQLAKSIQSCGEKSPTSLNLQKLIQKLMNLSERVLSQKWRHDTQYFKGIIICWVSVLPAVCSEGLSCASGVWGTRRLFSASDLLVITGSLRTACASWVSLWLAQIWNPNCWLAATG